MDETKQTTQQSDAGLQEQINLMEKKNKKLFHIALALMGVMIIFIILYLVTKSIIFMVIIMAFFAADAIMIFLASNSSRKTAIFIKENVTRFVLSEVFTVEEYKPKASFSKKQIKEAALVNGWNTFNGNDYFKGKYKGRGIEFSDIHLEYVRTKKEKNGNETEIRETVFKGPWIILQHEGELTEPLRVMEKRYLSYSQKKEEFAREFAETILMKKDEEIETESVEFNKQFQIFGKDGHIAFYVLTPNFMEYLQAADKKAQGTTLLRFEHNSVTIAVHNEHNFFESNSGGRRGTVEAMRRAWRDELKYLTDILDELLQNDYLFKK